MITEKVDNGCADTPHDRIIEMDYLTGLYNKKAITEYAMRECKAGDKVINLCILDIDNFKQINDTRGHAYGDKVLREVSGIILEVLGEDGRAGRIGGDEMMLIIENVEERADLRVYLKAIRERVESSHMDENGFPKVTVSMGIGTLPTYVDNYDDLFNLADRMLYRAKNRGKNRYVIYNPEIHGRIVNGELDENTAVVNRATAVDKTRLVMQSLEGLFDTMNEAMPTLLGKIVATYDLDEAYIFYKSLEKSIYGLKRIGDSGTSTEVNVLKTIDETSDISYVTEAGFESMFNANGVFVADTPGVQLIKHPKALEFFEEHGIRHAFIYRMQNTVYSGYIALYNTRQITRKFPQPDITDLTYLGKMIEIAIKTR